MLIELFWRAIGLATWGWVGIPRPEIGLLPQELIRPGMVLGGVGMLFLSLLFCRVFYLKNSDSFDLGVSVQVVFASVFVGLIWPLLCAILPLALVIGLGVFSALRLADLVYFLTTPREKIKPEVKALPKEPAEVELLLEISKTNPERVTVKELLEG